MMLTEVEAIEIAKSFCVTHALSVVFEGVFANFEEEGNEWCVMFDLVDKSLEPGYAIVIVNALSSEASIFQTL